MGLYPGISAEESDTAIDDTREVVFNIGKFLNTSTVAPRDALALYRAP